MAGRLDVFGEILEITLVRAAKSIFIARFEEKDLTLEQKALAVPI